MVPSLLWMEDGRFGEFPKPTAPIRLPSMKIVAIIPARSGSKSIADKNMQKVRGHSLIGWAVSVARATQCNEIFIDTDSREYAAEAEAYGAVAPFLRRAEFASDSSTDTETFSEFTSRLGLEARTMLVHLRPTTPLRSPKLVQSAIEAYLAAAGSRSALRSVHEMPESAYKTFELTSEKLLRPLRGLADSVESANQPRQMFPTTYSANGYVDVFPVENLRGGEGIHGAKVMGLLTPQSLEVDSSHELSIIRLLAEDPQFDEQVARMDKTSNDL